MVFLFTSCGEKKETEEKVTEQENTVAALNEKMCFLQVTEGKTYTGKTIRDSIIFEIEPFADGDSIKGIFNWKPYEKDTKLSDYKGVLKGNEGIAIATTRAEGMEYREEVLFTVNGDSLSVKFGEMVEDDNGIWRLKDKNNASVQVLQKVDCK
jgi:hypothetical protein